jgi:hypothetical protein
MISPHILKSMVLVVDLVRMYLLLLARRELARWIWIHFYFRPENGPVGYSWEDPQEGKKAALEISSRRGEISLFSFKSIKWVGRWGRLYALSGPQPMRKYFVPQPQNIRKIVGSFAWIDHRLLREGYLTRMAHPDLALYLFLVLAADRQGVSFYRKEKICDTLGLDFHQFESARDRLLDLALIAFEGYTVLSPNGYYQVLPLPRKMPDATKEPIQNLFRQLTATWNATNPNRCSGTPRPSSP